MLSQRKKRTHKERKQIASHCIEESGRIAGPASIVAGATAAAKVLAEKFTEQHPGHDQKITGIMTSITAGGADFWASLDWANSVFIKGGYQTYNELTKAEKGLFIACSLLGGAFSTYNVVQASRGNFYGWDVVCNGVSGALGAGLLEGARYISDVGLFRAAKRIQANENALRATNAVAAHVAVEDKPIVSSNAETLSQPLLTTPAMR